MECSIKLEDHDITDHKLIYTEVKQIRFLNWKEKITRSSLDTTKFKDKVFEKISQQNIKTLEDLTCIINETKEECTKQFNIKIMNTNYWITPDYLKKLK